MTISFDLSPELTNYARTIQEWAVSDGRPHARGADTNHAPPRHWNEILDGCPVPLGRADKPADDALPNFEEGSWVRTLTLIEHLNYGDVWMYGCVAPGIGHLVVESSGTQEQIERWYDPVIRGEMTTCFALTEPQFGSDTSLVATTAHRDGDMWVLNGTKIYASKGAQSDYAIVFATTDPAEGPKAIRPFIVPSGTEGFIVTKDNEEKLGLRSWVTSTLVFDNCCVPLDHEVGWCAQGVSGTPRSGRGAALAALSWNRPNISAIAIGLARAALDTTTAELSSRRIGFRASRWRSITESVANMTVALRRSKRMILASQDLVDRDIPDRSVTAMAKAYAPETAERIIRRCMQLLGPDGFSENFLLEKWYRDVKILDIFEGTGQIQRLIIGRGLMGRAAG
jgi:acyl-CoA dehydrogenase